MGEHDMNRFGVTVSRKVAGFTLVELLVVLAILALLAGLVGPKILGAFGGAKIKTARVQISELEKSLDVYKLDVGAYPTTEEGLQALVSKPSSVKNWNGPYTREIPQDPWTRPYKYTYAGTGDVEIVSLGADGSPGGEGENADIKSSK